MNKIIMRNLAIAFLLACSVYLDGQDSKDMLNVKAPVRPVYTMEDTIPQVVYKRIEFQEESSAAISVNGQHAKAFRFESIPAEAIKKVEIMKDTFVIDNSVYYGKILITLKREGEPELISINDLISKYTKPETSPDIIMIDNKIVSCDFDNSTVDERYIIQLVIEEIESLQDSRTIKIVNLITRTEENVEKANKISIR